MKKIIFTLFILAFLVFPAHAQDFYFGADQSYVNEMEDCGAVYKEGGVEKDIYEIYKDHGSNLVRLRLWHTPSWYDNLNEGNRYSDISDVKKSIGRAKAHQMAVLLDFHLSDNWADPSKQLVPAAWLDVVDDLPLLKDSLYEYIYATLQELASENLLPEMVQIGNETNKGILLSPEDNQGWTLDWQRNAQLFNSAIKAVRDVEIENSTEIEVVIHMAGPTDTEWFVDNFVANGVTDFDIIGISYYWAWHKPTTIAQTGEVIQTLKDKYPGTEILIVETGYIWTTAAADDANNIISETHPSYTPASPENQRDWLIDLTREVINKEGLGVIYWEPSWVSTNCRTQWGQGSHQEHATFFDFEHNLLLPGGIQWMEYDYGLVSPTHEALKKEPIEIKVLSNGKIWIIKGPDQMTYHYILSDSLGRILSREKIKEAITEVVVQDQPEGYYTISVSGADGGVYSEKFYFAK